MNKEYIEREAALKQFDENKPENWTNSDAEIQEQFDHSFYRGLVENVPTADVAEVRHGRWEWYVEPRYDLYSCDENFGYRCSECEVWAGEYGVDDDIYEEPPTHILYYCPNCGAKMDGKGEGDV